MTKSQKIEILRESLIEKNATFLFGAGASAPYFSSLGNFERVLSDDQTSMDGKNLIKAIFYHLSIKKNIYLSNYMNGQADYGSEKKVMLSIINEYSRFLHSSIEYLKVRNSRISPKRVNIITTNYDLFIESAIDGILENNPRIFFNDGANGYGKKLLSSDNYNKTLLYSGVFDNYSNEMPNINLIKCHGSVNWKEHKELNKRSRIQVLIEQTNIPLINQELNETLSLLSRIIEENEFLEIDSYEDLISLINEEVNEHLITLINEIGEKSHESLKNLISQIDTLQIVLPTKKKLQTTLVQEHFFNMLRFVSYELEKDQSVLVVFGFSFYDEHIRDVIQRSLNNPTLLVIIFCFTDTDKENIISQFNFSANNIPLNIIFIQPNDFLETTVSSEDFDEEKYDNTNHTIIMVEDTFFIYSKVISTITNDQGQEIPVINFSSFNTILEENITNRFISINIEETGEELG